MCQCPATEQFSDDARKAMVLANLMAEESQHPEVDTPHILHGILQISDCSAAMILSDLQAHDTKLREHESTAAQLLTAVGVTLDVVRARVGAA